MAYTLEKLPDLPVILFVQEPNTDLLDAEPALRVERRRVAREYLAEFFDVIANPRRSQGLFVDRCRAAPGM